MTEVKSRGIKRSGVVRRTVHRTTYEDIHEWVKANNANYDKANVRAHAEAFLDQWEKHAFEVYGRHGLPTFFKCWRAGPDQPWRPIEECTDRQFRVGESFSNVDLIGEKAAPDDSEVGFATALLKGTHETRRRLTDADDLATWRAFVDAAVLAQTFEAMHLEFDLAPWLGPGRLQAKGRRQGGLERATNARPLIEERHRMWATESAKLNANLSLRSKAKLIAKKLRGTRFAAGEDTIRKALAKNGA